MRVAERYLTLAITVLAVLWVWRRWPAESPWLQSVWALASSDKAPVRSVPKFSEAPTEILQVLAALDTTGTGQLPLALLEQALQLLGANPTKLEARQYGEALSEAGMRWLTAEALERTLRHHLQVHPPARDHDELIDAWELIDANGNGIVAEAEVEALIEMLTTLGEPLTPSEVETFVDEIDTDDDGQISRVEFLQLLGG